MKILKKIGAGLGIIALMAILGRAGYWDCHYYRYGIVTNVKNGVVTIEDKRGNAWEYNSTGFSKGDSVKLLMYTNHTNDTMFDDEIENISFS